MRSTAPCAALPDHRAADARLQTRNDSQRPSHPLHDRVDAKKRRHDFAANPVEDDVHKLLAHRLPGKPLGRALEGERVWDIGKTPFSGMSERE